MQKLTVSGQDSRPFLDKVLEYAVDHSLLNQNTLERLADECNDFHPGACNLFGLNIFDIGETLQAAKLVKQLLSLKLEGVSGGNVAVAVKVLAKYEIRRLLNSIVGEIQKELKRLQTIVQNTQRAETAFGYNITIFKGRLQLGKRTGLIPYFTVESFMAQNNLRAHTSTKCFKETCAGLTSAALFAEWQKDIDDLEKEIAVSEKFLPWTMLSEEAGLKPVSQIRNEFVWTAETLIATMCVILITGGSDKIITGSKRRIGTVYPLSHLPHLTRQILVSPKFRQAAVTAFADYLRSRATKSSWEPPDPSKFPNDEEYEILDMMIASAMEHLLKPREENPSGKPGLDYYLERLHVAIDATKFDKRQPAGLAISQSLQSATEKLLGAADRNATPATVKRLLKKISWEKADTEGITEEILQRVDGETLLTHLPLFPHLVTRLIAVWKTPNGQKLWPLEERRRLVKFALSGGSDLFWKELDPTTLEEMGAAQPEFKAQIEERYHIAYERLKRF